MGGRLSGLKGALYDSKKKQFLGRDGAGWAKLGIFYFFFYLGLAGFFCSMLAVFMALSPRDRPRYYSESSRMRTRSNPLTPGLGFRPQPIPDRNMIKVDKNEDEDVVNPYVKSLDQYLRVYYGEIEKVEKENDEDDKHSEDDDISQESRFIIKEPGDCRNETKYGFSKGKPCVLVKMNKIVNFVPRPGLTSHDKSSYQAACQQKRNAISIQCFGEYPADVDHIGNLTYFSESGRDENCGSIETKWFPYRGKVDRRDVYQAPYIWVQFNNLKANILINVLCRAYGQNIDFDKKSGRGLTRFQIYLNDEGTKSSSRQSGEI